MWGYEKPCDKFSNNKLLILYQLIKNKISITNDSFGSLN